VFAGFLRLSERRLANVPRCLVGLEAGCGSHHIARQIRALGHDVRLIPAQFVKPFLKGHKNDYPDAEAIAEAVQRPTMNFAVTSAPGWAWCRSRSRLAIAASSAKSPSAARLGRCLSASQPRMRPDIHAGPEQLLHT
jgi:transposase